MKKNILLIVSIVVCLMTLVPRTAYSAQYDNAENARSVGGISFYDDESTKVPPKDTKPPIKAENNIKGSLPKTGETQQNGTILLGLVFLSLVLIIKYKKNKQIIGEK